MTAMKVYSGTQPRRFAWSNPNTMKQQNSLYRESSLQHDQVNDLVTKGRQGKAQDWKYVMYECFVLYNKNYVLFTHPLNASDE